MGALLYMCGRRIKNNILDLRHQPGKVVLVLIFVGAFLLSALSPSNAELGGELRSMNEFYAIVFALYALFFGLCSYSGFGTGASMFSMSDVVMLFPSPLRPKTILTYGLVRQLGLAALTCFFMIYQYSWLHQLYGISALTLLIVLLGFMLVIFSSQLLAMLIYSATSGDDKKKTFGKVIFFAVYTITVGAAGLRIWMLDGNLFENVVQVVSSDLIALFPLAGWTKGMIAGLLSGEILPALLWALPIAAVLGGMIFLIGRVGTDFYEDVLAATEVAQSAITAKKENGGMNQYVRKNVKVGKIGIGAGSGASAIYHKLKVENRRARFFLIDTMSFIFLVITFVFTLIMYGMFAADDAGEAGEIAMVVALAMSVYMQLFSTAMGPFAKELRLPYIYMMPDSAFKKLIQCIRVQIPGFLLEGLLLWVPLMLILKLSPVDAALCVLARVTFGILFVASDVFVERFLGGLPKVLMTGMYFLLSIACIAPSAILAVFSGIGCEAVGLPVYPVAFLVLSVVNLVLGGLLLFAARNMLDCAEVNRS